MCVSVVGKNMLSSEGRFDPTKCLSHFQEFRNTTRALADYRLVQAVGEPRTRLAIRGVFCVLSLLRF